MPKNNDLLSACEKSAERRLIPGHKYSTQTQNLKNAFGAKRAKKRLNQTPKEKSVPSKLTSTFFWLSSFVYKQRVSDQRDVLGLASAQRHPFCLITQLVCANSKPDWTTGRVFIRLVSWLLFPPICGLRRKRRQSLGAPFSEVRPGHESGSVLEGFTVDKWTDRRSAGGWV